MSTILDTVSQQLGGDTVKQISQQIGADTQTTQNAISMALPVLVSGLAKEASDPQRLQGLSQALDKDHDGSLLDGLASMLGGGGAGASAMGLGGGGGLGGALGGVLGGGGGGGGGGLLGSILGGAAGGKILGHVLGGRRGAVEQGIGKATGMNTGQVAQLLMMLAPIVMAAVGRMKKQQNADAGGLGGMLQREQQEIQRRAPEMGGLGGMLDQNNDGRVIDDLMRMGTSMFGGRK